MKRYEGLYILNTAVQEDGVQGIVEEISAKIGELGGRIETVQKMDRKTFARVANKKAPSGYYVNIIFELAPSGIDALKAAFLRNDSIFRVLYTLAPAPVEALAS